MKRFPHISQPNAASLLLPHLPQLNAASLLPPGEGQDEGINEIGSPGHSDPLTPTLSRRERGFMGQHWYLTLMSLRVIRGFCGEYALMLRTTLPYSRWPLFAQSRAVD
jgi:hypothetical protein